jgi:capsular exopolysaccharide synthesis family protein
LIADKLDHVYHTADELKELGLPCLGTIPYNSSLSQAESLIADGELVTKEQLGKFSNRAHRDQMMFLEAFYSLDANIRLLSSDQPIRSITVSSTTPSDGKSTSSVHLALAAVMMGRRVLIIDMDMRRPQVHAWLGVQNLRGLSTAITSDVDVHELIQVSPQHRNLHVLTAGPMPPAPGRLLSSNKMRTILQELRHEYDLIICDTPPIAAFADAKLVAPCTDGLLLVVGIGKTDRTQLSQLIYDLRSSLPAPILGLLANGTKRSKNHYDYYNRYYADRRNDQVKRKLPNSSG